WLWHPYIPTAKVTSIEGDPGLGKSFLTTAIAAAQSKGAGLPGDTSPRVPKPVLMLTAEDGLNDTLRPRLDALGADLRLVHAVDISWDLDREGLVRFGTIIAGVKPVLVVVDPLVAFMGAKLDLHKANQVRSIMAGMAKIARDQNVAITVVRTSRKGRAKRHFTAAWALSTSLPPVDRC